MNYDRGTIITRRIKAFKDTNEPDIHLSNRPTVLPIDIRNSDIDIRNSDLGNSNQRTLQALKYRGLKGSFFIYRTENVLFIICCGVFCVCGVMYCIESVSHFAMFIWVKVRISLKGGFNVLMSKSFRDQ